MEWQAPGLGPMDWAFWALAIALPILCIYRRKRLDNRTAVPSAIALATFCMAARSMRNVSAFLLVALPAITSLHHIRMTPAAGCPEASTC